MTDSGGEPARPQPGDFPMFIHRTKFAAIVAGQPVLFFAVWASYLYVSSQPACGQGSDRPEVKADTLKQLRAERLAVLREIVKQTTEAFKAGATDYQQVSTATQALHQAELEQCESDKDRIAVLEKIVAQAKAAEQIADQRSKTGASQPWEALKARADRLQAEIDLAKAETKVATHPAAKRTNDRTAIAEMQVAVQQTAIKAAEAQKQMIIAQCESSRAQLAAAQAAESFADRQLQRYSQLSKSDAVASNMIDEQQQKSDAAKARRLAAEGDLKKCEAQVLLEDAHVEQARLEFEEAKLRLMKQKSTATTRTEGSKS
jgi:hypothetical protein